MMAVYPTAICLIRMMMYGTLVLQGSGQKLLSGVDMVCIPLRLFIIYDD